MKLIEYMRNHPLPQASLSVTQDLAAYAPDVKDRLRNKILKEKIRTTMSTMLKILERGQGDTSFFRTRLQKLVLQATTFKKPDFELLELLKDAEDLV
jgi:hypothetical protein